MIGRPAALEQDVRVLRHALLQLVDEPRLADPRLAGEEQDLAQSLLAVLPALAQRHEVLVAAQERRRSGAVRAADALDVLALALHPIDRDRRGHALELVEA